MRIDNSFVIEAPAPQVFTALVDLERVAPCMPGAEIEGGDDAGGYRGRFRIKVGPVSAAYRGRIEIASCDESRREVVLRGSGTDAGGGTATAMIASRVHERDGGSEVHMTTDLDVTGRLAQFGGRSSISQSVADRVVSQFAERLRAHLAGESATGAPATNGPAAPASPASGQPPAREPEALDGLAIARDVAREQVVRPWTLALLVGFVAGIAVARRGTRRSRRRR